MIKTTDMRKQQAKNRGLTLIELLVTIAIMGIVIAIAVPVIRPPVDARSVKEAARMVSTALASARTKSIETGQSWGVEFTPFPNDSRQVGTLHFVRVTSPYEGTDGVIAEDPPDSGSYKFVGLDDSAKISVPSNVLQRGGWLRFGYQGKKYLVEAQTPYPVPLDPAPATGAPTDAAGNPLGVEFQFYPAPRKSSLMPIQLPSRAVVDMGLSGWGDGDDCFTPHELTPIKITFTPTGEVDQVYHSAFTDGVSVIERLHFFIGKTGRTGTTPDGEPPDPEDNHLVDGEAIWVSVDPRTGAIKSAENNPANSGDESGLEDARKWANE